MTVLEVLNRATECFKEHQIRNPRLNAELLLACALDFTREGLYIHLHDPVGEKGQMEAEELIQRRLSGEPLQYILGHQEFWSTDLRVDPRVLIPRPDTELLVEQVLTVVKKGLSEKTPVILDLGTGSGAVSIALAREVKDIFLVATDVSKEALQLAGLNAREQQISGKIGFVLGDLFGPFKKGALFDLILSNPPYIRRTEIASLEREVRDFEPLMALNGGEDGLDFHRKIICESPDYLRGDGWLLLEVGQGQAEEVSGVFEQDGRYHPAERIRDLSGIERVIKARKK